MSGPHSPDNPMQTGSEPRGKARLRASHTKSRNGCQACKLRRVKVCSTERYSQVLYDLIVRSVMKYAPSAAPALCAVIDVHIRVHHGMSRREPNQEEQFRITAMQLITKLPAPSLQVTSVEIALRLVHRYNRWTSGRPVHRPPRHPEV